LDKVFVGVFPSFLLQIIVLLAKDEAGEFPFFVELRLFFLSSPG